MDDRGVPQPDSQLRILPECGGQGARRRGLYRRCAGAGGRDRSIQPKGRPRRQARRLRARRRPGIHRCGPRHEGGPLARPPRRQAGAHRPDAEGHRSASFLGSGSSALLRKDLAASLPCSIAAWRRPITPRSSRLAERRAARKRKSYRGDYQGAEAPMSTVERRTTATTASPPLADGQRLDQAEFMRRYELTPPGFTAELIGGIVHVASPLSSPHGRGSCPRFHLDRVVLRSHPRDRRPGQRDHADGRPRCPPARFAIAHPARMRRPGSRRGRIRRRCAGTGGRDRSIQPEDRSRRQARRLRTRRRPGVYRRGPRHQGGSLARPSRRQAGCASCPIPMGSTAPRSSPGSGSIRRRSLRKDLAGVLDVLDRGLATPEHAAFVASLADEAAAGALRRMSLRAAATDGPECLP